MAEEKESIKTGSFSLKYLNFLSNFKLLKKAFIDFFIYYVLLLIIIDIVIFFLNGDANVLSSLYNIKHEIIASRRFESKLPYINHEIGVYWGYASDLLVKSAYLLIIYPVIFFFINKLGKRSTEKFLRGAKLISVNELKNRIKEAGLETGFPLGDFNLPIKFEPNHAFIIGRPGVGKTVMALQIIENILARKHKALLYDYKGDYMRTFYNPDRDYVFNPIDERSLNWNIFEEIATDFDIESIAGSLIPTPADAKDKYWTDAARAIFAGVLKFIRTNFDNPDNELLWNTLCKTPEELYNICKESKNGSEKFLSGGPSPMPNPTVASVISTLTQHTICFKYASGNNKNQKEFKIKDWLYSDESSILFLINYPDIKDTLSPFISLFIDLLSKKLLSMEDDRNRRIFLLLDEFGTLSKLPTLIQILTASRSKGGSCWIFIQDFGQIDLVYGKETRSTIINSAGIGVSFALSDFDTADTISKKLGKKESISKKESFNLSAKSESQSLSQSEEKSDKDIVTPSELLNLPNLQAFVKIPDFDVVRVKFDYTKFHYTPSNAEPFKVKKTFSVGRGTNKVSSLDKVLKKLRNNEDDDEEDFEVDEAEFEDDNVTDSFKQEVDEEIRIAKNKSRRSSLSSSKNVFNEINKDIEESIKLNMEIINECVFFNRLRKIYSVE